MKALCSAGMLSCSPRARSRRWRRRGSSARRLKTAWCPGPSGSSCARIHRGSSFRPSGSAARQRAAGCASATSCVRYNGEPISTPAPVLSPDGGFTTRERGAARAAARRRGADPRHSGASSSTSCRASRQAHVHRKAGRRPARMRIGEPKGAAMALDDRLDDRQTKPAAWRGVAGQALKALEAPARAPRPGCRGRRPRPRARPASPASRTSTVTSLPRGA